jgi:hypothetical protein
MSEVPLYVPHSLDSGRVGGEGGRGCLALYGGEGVGGREIACRLVVPVRG